MIKKTLRLLQIAILLLLPIASALAEPVKVGVSLPLSGMATNYGKAFMQGLQLYQAENPESQKQFTFAFEDHKYQGPDVISSSEKLVRSDKVDMLIVWGATPSEVIAPKAKQLKVPVFVFTFSAEGKERPNVVSLYLPMEDHLEGIVRWIKEKNINKVGYLGTNIGAVEVFLKSFKEKHSKLEYEITVGNEEKDFKTIIAQISKTPVDLLLLMLIPDQIELFAQQAKAMNFKTSVLSGDMLGDSVLREKVKLAMDEVSYLSGTVDADFHARYKDHYKNDTHINEANSAYFFCQVLASYLKDNTEKFNAENFLETLSTLKLKDTVIGEANFFNTPETGIAVKLNPQIMTERLAE